MGRKPGFDEKKIARILTALIKNPDGLWIRRLGKETSMHPTTATKYIDGPLKPLIEDVSLGREGKPFLRVIRVKPFVIEKLQEGKDVTQILRMLKIIEKVG